MEFARITVMAKIGGLVAERWCCCRSFASLQKLALLPKFRFAAEVGVVAVVIFVVPTSAGTTMEFCTDHRDGEGRSLGCQTSELLPKSRFAGEVVFVVPAHAGNQ